jgi:membrane protein DedA with SNARE-associated domain
MGLTSGLVDFAVDVIESLGYVGVFVLMTLESMVAPIPSEGVMPFAGFLVHRGEMDLWLVSIVATLGSLLGSGLSYLIGLKWGRPFVDRWGRYVLLSHRDLDWSERFFARFGTWAVLAGRLIPVVRHLISIPAGLAKMRLAPFFLATAIGAFAWNFFLTWAGMKLAENWETVKTRMEPFDYAILVVLFLGAVWFFWMHWKRARRPVVNPT